jgi:hypothetical protein
LQSKHKLLHRDSDFDSFEKVLGLQVVQASRSRLAPFTPDTPP